MIPSKEVRDGWRKESEEAMHSAVWEYCPKDEFYALLDAVDELEAAADLLPELVEAAYCYCDENDGTSHATLLRVLAKAPAVTKKGRQE